MSFFPCDLAAPASPSGPVVEWEETDCLLCGGRRWSHLVEAPDAIPGGTGLWFAVVQCQDCGLCFTNPRPNIHTIGQFYPSYYRPHRSPIRRQRWRWHLPLPHTWRRAGWERRSLPWHGQGRLLDFGCGGGTFLERMHHQAWQVTGIDVSASVVHQFRSRTGLRALVGTLPHPDLRPGDFDVITMWQALEHVHAPMEVLREAHRLLAPDGRLIVAVPNIDSLPYRWFGPSWSGLDLPRHLTHFSPWTLQLMLERAGFCAGPVRMVRHCEWLRTSARLCLQNRRGPHWYRWLLNKPAAILATWYGAATQQSDCMLVHATKNYQ